MIYTLPTAAQASSHQACDRKQCRDCEDSFPLSEFYFISKSAGTRASYCKTCNKARVRVAHKKSRALAAVASQPDPLNLAAAAWIRTS